MIFFVANDGTVISSVPSPVYQGGANTNNIFLVAPFAENLQASVAFKLPNGVYTTRYPMVQANNLTGIVEEKSGKTYNGWQFSMPNDITQYYGTVTAQFFFYSAQGGIITTTSAVTFVVERGVPAILPDTPSEDVYEIILSNLAALSQQLNNGAFSARAIYAWNSAYTYGMNELTFYADYGKYGAFIKSLKSNNTDAPFIDGKFNSDSWLLVSDFNILNGLYSLQTQVEEALAQSRANAEAAGESASAAESSRQGAADSATTAQEAAESVKDSADYLESVKDGTVAVTKAVSDGNGENIAEHFEDIEHLIPSTTTPENQLADQAFVNSSINAMAAFYITSNAVGDAFTSKASLTNATTFYQGGQARVPTQNDYAIVLADESQPKGVDGKYPTTRYSYQGGTYPNGQWDFQYVVNNTSLTQAQVDAVNSGITAALVEQININKENIENLESSNVTGVKGNAETAYRTGKVNLTPANIGALPSNGNAASATKLQTARAIDGVNFDGVSAINHYGVCLTSVGTTAKVVSITGFILVAGARITVKFTYANTVSSPTLNVNSTGAKTIYAGNSSSNIFWEANEIITFVYDGTYWRAVNRKPCAKYSSIAATNATAQQDTVVEYYRSSDGNSWYRIWASGWKEMGGIYYCKHGATTIINLPRSFVTQTYILNAITSTEIEAISGAITVTVKVGSKTTSSFGAVTSYNNYSPGTDGGVNINWYACGY